MFHASKYEREPNMSDGSQKFESRVNCATTVSVPVNVKELHMFTYKHGWWCFREQTIEFQFGSGVAVSLFRGDCQDNSS